MHPGYARRISQPEHVVKLLSFSEYRSFDKGANMSADNYVLVRSYKGGFLVSDESMSADEP